MPAYHGSPDDGPAVGRGSWCCTSGARGPGSSAPAQRQGPHRRRDRRAAVTAGHLAAGHPAGASGLQRSEADAMSGTERPGADGSALSPGQMTEAEFRSLYQRLRDELPWGADDRRGALNYITAAEVLAAVGEVTMGRTVSVAAPVEHWPSADNPNPAQHDMKG